jgi:geranylgeranyl reductase
MKVAIIGGGPAGATAASTLAKAGVETYLIEKDLKSDKPCGGGIPSGSLRDFGIPDHLFERKVSKVGIIAPSGYEVLADLGDGYIGMVDRVKFDPWLREKAVESGARLIEGVFTGLQNPPKSPFSKGGQNRFPPLTKGGEGGFGERIKVVFKQGEKEDSIQVDAVIAADGANSSVARQLGAERPQVYLTIQEKVELAGESLRFYEDRCDFRFGSDFSPNFYGWIFPKSDFATIGTGAPYNHGKHMDDYLAALKKRLSGRFDGARVLKRQAFPLPLGPIKRKVYGKILLAGDAAGTVMPVSGEGIYYSMMSGKLAAEAVIEGDLSHYERQWNKFFGAHFRQMAIVRWLFLRDDKWRERLVRMHEDKDAQKRALALWLDKNKEYPIYSIYWKMVKSLIKHL